MVDNNDIMWRFILANFKILDFGFWIIDRSSAQVDLEWKSNHVQIPSEVVVWYPAYV